MSIQLMRPVREMDMEDIRLLMVMLMHVLDIKGIMVVLLPYIGKKSVMDQVHVTVRIR